MHSSGDTEIHGAGEPLNINGTAPTKDQILGRKFFVGSTMVSNARFLYRKDKVLFEQVHKGQIELSEACEIVRTEVDQSTPTNGKTKKAKKLKWKAPETFKSGPEWVQKGKVSPALAAVFRGYWKQMTSRSPCTPHPAMEALMCDFKATEWVADLIAEMQQRKAERNEEAK